MLMRVFFASFISTDPAQDGAVIVARHGDSVWDIKVHNVLPLIASASADGTCCVRNWSSATDKRSPIQTLTTTSK